MSMPRRTSGANGTTQAAGSGNFEVGSVQVPNKIESGLQVPVSVRVTNTSTIVTPLDGDFCQRDGKNGQRVEVTVSAINGPQTASETLCVPAFGGEDILSVNLPQFASSGDKTLRVSVVGANTRQQVAEESVTVSVVSTGNGDGGNSSGDQDNENDDNSSSSEESRTFAEWWASLNSQEKGAVAVGGAGVLYALTYRR